MSEFSPTALSGRRVLLVEDEPLLALEVAMHLERAGCEVVGPLTRVPDALSAANTGEIDMAVLDVDLNGEQVWPVADVLAKRRVPFLFVTGFRRPAHIPPTSWVGKPVQYETLVAGLIAVSKK